MSSVEKLFNPKWSRMTLPPGLQICLASGVILTFVLLAPKVDRLIPLSRGPCVPVGIKIGSHFFSKYFVHNLSQVS